MQDSPGLGPHEIAVLFGVSRQRVYQLMSRPDFPEPWFRLAQGNVWRTEDVLEWARARGRKV